jgi:rhodanese-related sulfurtransferase
MYSRITKLLTFAVVLLLSACITTTAGSAGKMSKEILREKLGEDRLVVLDVRTGSDWENSDYKIRGAVRVDPRNVAGWSSDFNKNDNIVLYCA